MHGCRPRERVCALPRQLCSPPLRLENEPGSLPLPPPAGDVPVRGEMRPLSAPQDCPQEVVDLYERCIAEQPEQRPTAAELLQTLAAQL